jgi:hypothetical protein
MLRKSQQGCTGGNDDPVILYKHPVCRLGYPRLFIYLDLLLLIYVPVNRKSTYLPGAPVTPDKHPPLLQIFQILSNRNLRNSQP